MRQTFISFHKPIKTIISLEDDDESEAKDHDQEYKSSSNSHIRKQILHANSNDGEHRIRFEHVHDSIPKFRPVCWKDNTRLAPINPAISTILSYSKNNRRSKTKRNRRTRSPIQCIRIPNIIYPCNPFYRYPEINYNKEKEEENNNHIEEEDDDDDSSEIDLEMESDGEEEESDEMEHDAATNEKHVTWWDDDDDENCDEKDIDLLLNKNIKERIIIGPSWKPSNETEEDFISSLKVHLF